MPHRPLHSSLLTAGLGALLAMAGCTSGAALGSTGTVTLTSPVHGSAGATVTSPTSTSITPTPVTPNGLLTGAGVTTTTISLGLLVDAAADRGFSTGVALWQRAVNTSGGICGRTIVIRTGSAQEDLTTGYGRIAGTTLGLITLPAESEAPALAALSSADQIPVLTLTGSSTALTKTGPVVIGPTEDIKTINALAYLRSTGKLPAGSSLGVVTDGAAEAANALQGAQWWAKANDVTLVSRTVSGGEIDRTAWTGVGAVLVVATPSQVQATLRGVPADTDVITDLDGYDPSAPVTTNGPRLLVSLAAPAYGSDNPGAAAVAKAFVASGRTDPGPDLLSGFGVAANWGRLLTQACVERSLTRSGVEAAMTTVGPASVDSLFGPSDPGLVVGSALPATRVSSVALADPKAPAGLRPLIWLQAAPGIADYVPQKP
ncbi:hypothetical protein ABIB25_001342 [Nakamurella sp. UYEF19]|uniref:hypothetical protein n=1 Tax=Nakamurella sp. UYEF19 TaxID=1756392 RepID=UPI0033967730